MVNQHVIGIDFGSDSVRCVVISTQNGEELASSVKYYPRWKERKYCDPKRNQYRQHPNDYIESLESAIGETLSTLSPYIIDSIDGISFDTTASTPVIVDKNGTPLALLPHYSDNPDAMFILWKDHTSIAESEEINVLAKEWHIDYLKYSGGTYSCEWVWSKMLHILRTNPQIREDAYSWIEHCDWISALLTGKTRPEEVVRSRCAAGHKAMWHSEWGGLPSKEFLTKLDPQLAIFRDHLYTETFTSDTRVGGLTKEWAQKLGLKDDISVGIGAIDCHIGAIGVGIKPNVLVKVMGTSTCDIITTEYKNIGTRTVSGICGQVDGSVTPGHIGFEAGQSAFGDVFAWFKEIMCWPLRNIAHSSSSLEDQIIIELSNQATQIPIEESSIIALDWLNGRRTPDANPKVKGALTGLTLSTTPPMIFRALVEATAMGSRAINERLADQGVVINEIIALGGITKKSPFVMQTMADVIGVPIKITRSEQTCAAGAAMFAAVVAGIHSNIEQAQEAMCSDFEKIYVPIAINHAHYNKIYEKYKALGNFIDTF